MYEMEYAMHFCGPLFVSLLVEIRFIIIEENFGRRYDVCVPFVWLLHMQELLIY